VIFTEPQGGRYPPLSELPLQGEWIRDPAKAIEIAKAEDCDLILVIGSLYLCGNILQYLGKDSDDDLDILSQSS
jgi:folylpolyglutamate synthase/dihydropteroate synthase